jgi:DNA uptake protein ComE-like DNA-binding protein
MHQRPFLNAAAERINPNTASVASLVRLPGIGRARALDIVHYRDNQHTEKVVFSSPQDLENIKGIGPKTAQNISPCLVFEESEPQMNTKDFIRIYTDHGGLGN